MIERIVSGGQTGVDRAALDVALELGIPCGGWRPKDRRAEDGVIPERHPLIETDARNYNKRTKLNVQDSDGTLVINRGTLDSGTAYTVQLTEYLEKPCLVVDMENPPAITGVEAWLACHEIKTLNVAGPRESKRPGIYDQAMLLLKRALSPRS